LLTLSTRAADAQPIEGFGSISKGGAGGEVYHVTKLGDSGTGTLRYALNNRSQAPLTIVFDVGGTIVLQSDIIINQPFLTIDGTTAPSPGITVKQGSLNESFIVAGTHDVILKSLRFQGLFVDGGPNGGNNPLLIIDGDSKPDYLAQRIVFDHITVAQAGDSGPDIWADVRDVTVQWSFFYASLHPTTVSATPGANMVRQRISMHHNVYAVNGERNPQLRGDVRTLDYVNNVVYGWGAMPLSNVNSGYGILVRNEPGEPKVNGANFVNNAFVAIPNQYVGWGLVYGDKPGADLADGGPAQVLQQGQVYLGGRMGDLWVSGNILPKANKDHYSTVSQPISIGKPVTTWPATQLKDLVLPGAGTQFRTLGEEQLLDKIAAALSGQPGPGPSPSPSPSPSPKPSPSPTATPKPSPKPSPSATPKPSPKPSPHSREHREEARDEQKPDEQKPDGWDTFKRRVEQLYCRVTGC
jgi:pectate lyase